MRIQLHGGSYTSRSVIASAQRCINYYAEANPHGPTTTTHYQRPGLKQIGQVGLGPIRGLFRASTGVGYVVSGSEFFRINGDSTFTKIGDITTGRTNLVSMTDNGIDMLLVDGSTSGWKMPIVDGTSLTLVSDDTGTFAGADKVDYTDTFIIWNLPKSVFFGSTKSNVIEFDTFFFAGKVSYPDNLKTLWVIRRQILLFGDVKTEVWYNAGADETFPFAQLPGYNMEHGITAIHSVASHDSNVYWLGRNLQGEGVVMQFRSYIATRISNFALEDAIAKMQKTVGVEDAIGFTYQKDGHQFYMLSFPKGDQTWVYDATIADIHFAWHQEAWTDIRDGSLHRHRANCHAFVNGMNLVGDWENNWIYEMDLDTYTDTVNNVVSPIACIKGFPHLVSVRADTGSQFGRNYGNNLADVDGRRLQFASFRADMECGMGPTTVAGLPAQVSLRWSDDRGRTFGNDVLQSSGFPGEYLTQPQWLGMGIARDRIFEISHSIGGPAALNGAWVEVELLST